VNERRQLPLTPLRFVAAAVVVIFHFGRWCSSLSWGNAAWNQGHVAVSFFFVLSGFVLAHANQDGVLNLRNFYVARLARILPAYWLGLLGMAAYTASVGQFHVQDFVAPAFLVQSWIPGWSFIIKWPGWSLSVELFFYLTFPFLLAFVRRLGPAAIAALAVVAWSASMIAIEAVMGLHPASGSVLEDFVSFNPLVHYSSFILGVSGGVLYDRGRKINLSLTVVGVAIFASASVARAKLAHDGLLSPVFLALIWKAAGSRSRLLTSKIGDLLGEASYSLYILQGPVALACGVWYLHPYPNAYFWSLFALMIWISIASYKLVEVPARRFIRREATRFLAFHV